jgi:hypothetical protein
MHILQRIIVSLWKNCKEFVQTFANSKAMLSHFPLFSLTGWNDIHIRLYAGIWQMAVGLQKVCIFFAE